MGKTWWWSLGILSPCQGTSACGWDCSVHGLSPGWFPMVAEGQESQAL